MNKIIAAQKEQYYTIEEPDKLIEYINNNISSNEKEKKEYGEVFTPIKLVKEMLDKLPNEVWSDPNLKWLDPAVGIGNFPIIAYLKLMEGLKDWESNEEKRRKYILENMLYMVEINKKNIIILEKLLCGNKYKLNIFEGSFIDGDDYDKVFPTNEKFDIIMGNPPYASGQVLRKSKAIWHLFTKKSIDLLKTDGYLLFVHPSSWRSPDGIYRDVYDKIMSKNLIYLNMNDFHKGNDVFGVGTNYDYYILQNNDIKQSVKIVDIYDKKYNMDLSNWSFIPSGCFELYKKVLALKDEEKVEVCYSRSLYGTDKSNMQRVMDEKYKFPCIYTITIKDGINCWYSSEKKGHFDIPKVIWSNGLGTYPIVDEIGKYGLTQFSYAIIDKKNNLNDIKNALNSINFIKLMECVKFTNNKYNYKVIALMKTDFWMNRCWSTNYYKS